MHLLASTIAAVTAGVLHGDDVEVDGAAVDSRVIRGGELFVPVRAERDGHDFIDAALDAGAAAYLTVRPPTRGTAIEVANSELAFKELGRHARELIPDRVIGITGSVGKTTVKDLARAVLSMRFRTAANERSFNNELGVPLTLLNAPDETEATVVEMGARGRGHIEDLCRIARPTVGVVTVVAAAHMELFGTIEDVAAAKGELIEALPPWGTAVLNADDPLVLAMAARCRAGTLTFGVGGEVRATGISLDDELRPRFRLESPWGRADVAVTAHGAHQVSNALAAAAAALACGVTPDEVAAGLGAATLSPWRMEVVRTPSGAVVVNDSYNANPASTEAALEALAALPARRRIALLGVMAELGPDGPALHRTVAARAAALGIRVVAVATPDYGGGVEVVPDVDAALAAVGELRAGDAVLVKGSRVAGLEVLAERLAGAVAATRR